MTPTERADSIMAAKGWGLRVLLNEAQRLAQGPGSLMSRGHRMMGIGGEISNMITPFTPCKDGCSHCCHMAVMVSSFEAEEIAAYTERPLVANAGMGVEEVNERHMEKLEKYTDVPCTFLKEGKCSIYPVRPIACRTHHTVNDTNADCKIVKGSYVTTPFINLNEFLLSYVKVFLEGGCTFTDIREWFPPEA